MKKIVLYTLIVSLIVSVTIQGYFTVMTIQITGQVIPNTLSIFYLAWQDSYDTFIGVPNITLFPIILLGLWKLYDYLEQKEAKQKAISK
jgi:hypothetical protein